MVADAMHAEACALAHAIQIADHLDMGKVIFETDCLNLKHAMANSEYAFSPIGILISDLKYQIRLNFIEARVEYVPRNCKRPARTPRFAGTSFPTYLNLTNTSTCTCSNLDYVERTMELGDGYSYRQKSKSQTRKMVGSASIVDAYEDI